MIIAHVLLHDRSPLFDLDLENNIPTYFAAAQVFLAALLMVEIHVTERKYFKRIVPGTWVWIILAAAFAYLAIDDVAAIHEYVLRHTARDLLPPDSLWISLMPWQIIFAPLFALIAALLVTIMLTRFIKDRTLLRLAGAALGCWIFAVLMEGLAKIQQPRAAPASRNSVLSLMNRVSMIVTNKAAIRAKRGAKIICQGIKEIQSESGGKRSLAVCLKTYS